MRRAELEHVIRAAAEVASEKEIVIVGSQAILAQYPDAPDELLRLQEADVYPRDAPAKAAQIDVRPRRGAGDCEGPVRLGEPPRQGARPRRSSSPAGAWKPTTSS